LIVEYQHRFHVEPLLILDPINSGPACSLKSLDKFSFPSHAVTAGPPRKRLECTLPLPGSRRHHLRWDHLIAAAMMGPLRRRRCPRAGTSSMQPLWPLHRHRRRSATEEQGAPAPHTSTSSPMLPSTSGPCYYHR
jgi:hypothetical protein